MIIAATTTTPHLPGVLHTLEPTLNQYGYLAVAGLVFLEDFGVPVPGETILILGAVYAGTGRLNVWLVALLGFCAAVLGDNLGFAIGHFGGRPLVERFGRYILLTPERLDKAQGFFERHGGKIIVVARFVEGLRQANGIIAGISGLHWAKFIAFNALGAALWVGVWTSVGYFSGNNIDSIYHTATKYSTYFAILVGVLLLAFIARLVWRHQRRKRERGAEAGEAATEVEQRTGPSETRTEGNQEPEPSETRGEGNQEPEPSETRGEGNQEPEPSETRGEGGRRPG